MEKNQIMFKSWMILFIAIIAEVIATSCLKSSDGFKKFIPSIITVVGYIISFYSLSIALRYIPLGIAYAIWSGFGIIALTAIGLFVFHQKISLLTVIGIILIIIGIIISYSSL